MKFEQFRAEIWRQHYQYKSFSPNGEIDVPDLIRAALSHYQFETVHPFLDGNGRIGRLLITLHLVSKGLLSRPSLYLSDFFELNRASYYDALMRVRIANDLNHWVRFFLTGVAETAKRGAIPFSKYCFCEAKSNIRYWVAAEEPRQPARCLIFCTKNRSSPPTIWQFD